MTFIMIELLLMPVMALAAIALIWGLADLYKQRHRKADDKNED